MTEDRVASQFQNKHFTVLKLVPKYRNRARQTCVRWQHHDARSITREVQQKTAVIVPLDNGKTNNGPGNGRPEPKSSVDPPTESRPPTEREHQEELQPTVDWGTRPRPPQKNFFQIWYYMEGILDFDASGSLGCRALTGKERGWLGGPGRRVGKSLGKASFPCGYDIGKAEGSPIFIGL